MPHSRSYFHTLVLLLAGLCSLPLSGCRNAAASDTVQASQPLLLFQKTPCYGFCPAYDATIYEDGSITYIGYRNAPIEDTLQLCLTSGQLQQLKTSMDSLNYASLQSAYLSQRTDQPSTYFTFYQNGREVKRIKHQEGGPPELLQFQDMIEGMVTGLVAERMMEE